MMYLLCGFAVLVAFILLLALYILRQNRRLTKMTKAIADILVSQNSQLLFTDKSDTIGKLTFEINKIISDYRSEKRDREKEQQVRKKLIADLSHDVRTPLVSVIGYLEAVVDKRVEESFTAEYLNTALSKATELRGQINQLFEFAQCDADEIQLKPERLEVCELLRQVLIEFLPLIERDSIEWSAKIPEEEIFVLADRQAVIRICRNLIRNTLEHGKSGKYIGVGLSRCEGTVILDIADKGAGIASKDLPFIFDRLYKADQARVRGGGLGLAVAKELAEKMKGTVSVLRSLPGNTVFRVTFPEYR